MELKSRLLSEKELSDLEKMSVDQLLKELLKQTKALKMIDKQRRDDVDLLQVKGKIKAHREKSLSTESGQKLTKLKEQIKVIKEEIDAKIPELLNQQKEINKNYREDKAFPKEKLKLINRLLDSKN